MRKGRQKLPGKKKEKGTENRKWRREERNKAFDKDRK
jgi:hypothetical protein